MMGEDGRSSLIQAQDQKIQKSQAAEDLDVSYVFVGRRENPPNGGSTKIGDLRLRLSDKLLEKGEWCLEEEENSNLSFCII